MREPPIERAAGERPHLRPRRREAALVALAALASTWSPHTAHADKVDALTSALLGDPSYRVKVQAALTLGKLKIREGRAVQALIEALRDDSEAVRGVAAGSLGKIGDPSASDALRALASQDASAFVRAQAQKAAAEIAKSTQASSGSRSGAMAGTGAAAGSGARARWFLDVSEISPGKADAASAKRVSEHVVAALARIPNVTLSPEAGAPLRFHVEGNITNLAATPPDATGKVRTDCDARFIVATWPDKSIKMMATVGGSLDGTAEPSDLAASRSACLGDLASQIAEKVQTFLETQR